MRGGHGPGADIRQLDLSFNPGASGLNNAILSVAIQSTSRVVAGGDLTNVSGLTRLGSARPNTDGSVDAAFKNYDNARSSVRVYSVVVQSDGKTLVGGYN